MYFHIYPAVVCSEDEEERSRRRDKYKDDWSYSDKDWDRECTREKNLERDQNRSRYDYKDDDNEVTSVERTHTTRTEKITTTKGRTRQAKTLELGASSSFGSDGQVSMVFCFEFTFKNFYNIMYMKFYMGKN